MTSEREVALNLVMRLLAGEQGNLPMHLALLLEKSSLLQNSEEHYQKILPPELARVSPYRRYRPGGNSDLMRRALAKSEMADYRCPFDNGSTRGHEGDRRALTESTASAGNRGVRPCRGSIEYLFADFLRKRSYLSHQGGTGATWRAAPPARKPCRSGDRQRLANHDQEEGRRTPEEVGSIA